ncbi:MAG: DUF4412 domain-containing protein [Candidatus Aminicenantes bacterium]|nr:DUF4412 domain-containing protein [Candidatus Aminicenantes bacterium]
MKKILTVITLVCVFTLFSFAGIEWSVKTTSEGQKKGESKTFTAHVYAQAGNLKQVFEDVSNADDFHIKNGYWLFKSSEENIYIVNEKEKSYMEMSLDSLMQLTGFIGQLVKIEIRDHTITSEKLGSETIAGYKCKRLKLTTDYTMKMKIAFIKKTIKVHEVKEIWAVPNLKGFNELNKTFLNKDFKTGFPDLDELIKEQMEKQGKIGFPLKTITHNVQRSKKGKVKSDTTTTMEVTGIKFTNFPKSFFEIPEGYQKMETKGNKKLGIF